VGQKLNALDLAFLALETHKTPVNVASLVVLREPEGQSGNFVRELLDELLQQEPGPPFDRRLSNTRIGRPEWVTDQHFDMEYHVRHSALPRPGTRADLLALVSRLHSRVMDRERPLWEFHIIEGLADKRFAIYTKMHHAAIDGIGGIELLEACFTPDASASPRAPWAGTARKRRSRKAGGLLERVAGGAKQLVSQAQLSTGLGKLLIGHGMKAVGLKPNHSPVPFTAPKSLFNVPISGARRFEVATLSLAEIRSLGKQLNATVNDIVLAICSGALRSYLREKRSLPTKSLVATVPVSVRQLDRSGNQITYVAAKLGTNRKTPLSRLRAIAESTMQAKREVASVSPAAASTFAVVSQGLVAVLNRFQLTEWLPPPANVVISNVPGPRQPLFFGGARMEANYPLSVLVDGQALNITVISYCDSVDFGLMADRDTVPDADRLAAMVTQAFAELKQAAADQGEQSSGKPRLKRVAKSGANKALKAKLKAAAKSKARNDGSRSSEVATEAKSKDKAAGKKAKAPKSSEARSSKVAQPKQSTKAKTKTKKKKLESKTGSKTPSAKQPKAKKTPAKKVGTKKAARKKAAKKSSAKKAGTKKAGTKKARAKKTSSKKAGSKKSSKKKTASRVSKKSTAKPKKTLRQARNRSKG